MKADTLAVWHLQEHFDGKEQMHGEPQIYYILEGSVTVTQHSQANVRKAGELFLADSFDHVACEGSGHSLAAVLEISGRRLSKLAGTPCLDFSGALARAGSSGREVLRIRLHRSLSLYLGKEPFGALRFEESIYPIMEWLINYGAVQPPQNAAQKLAYMRSYIHQNYDRPCSLSLMARQLQTTIPYLSRIFQRGAGCGFKAYLDRVRLFHAMEAVRDNGGDYVRAAADSGFPNMVSFYRVFKSVYQMTPSQYVFQKAAGTMDGAAALQLEERAIRRLKELKSETPVLPVSADVRDGKDYEKNWMTVLNLGFAQDLLREDIQEHILLLKKGLDFQYGRVAALFDQRLFIDIHATSGFNFSRVDQVLDVLVHHHIIPFLDLGLRPKTLFRKIGDVMMTETMDQNFSGIDQYRRLIEAFIQHCIRRYGQAEVSRWRIELCWDYKRDRPGFNTTRYNVFCILYTTVKRLSPRTLVGGFGFNIYDSHRLIREYMQNYDGRPVSPDFISVLVYPYKDVIPGAVQASAVNWDIDFMAKEIQALAALMDSYGWDAGRLYITEWNISISNANYLHDSCYKAAYILRAAAAAIGQAGCMAYWGSMDRTGEHFDSLRLLNGRTGLISKNGICKPAYYAYMFLNRMGKRLIKKDPHYILTAGSHGELYMVCGHLTAVRPQYQETVDEAIPALAVKDLFDETPLTFHICLEHADAPRYQVEKMTVDSAFGSVLDDWLRIDDHGIGSPMETAYLKSVCVPYFEMFFITAKAGCIEMTMTLKSNAIGLLEFTPLTQGDEN